MAVRMCGPLWTRFYVERRISSRHFGIRRRDHNARERIRRDTRLRESRGAAPQAHRDMAQNLLNKQTKSQACCTKHRLSTAPPSAQSPGSAARSLVGFTAAPYPRASVYLRVP
jgi:hypothetical protein